jgi:integrase
MPLKLVPPRKGQSTNWRVRGTHLHTHVDQSTGFADRKKASKVLQEIKQGIEDGRLKAKRGPTFAEAVISYVNAGGDDTFLKRILLHFGETPLAEINQGAVDAAATALYPKATDATKNRQVYTPISAVLKHSHIDTVLHRPKGYAGTKRTAWLREKDAFALLDAADKRHPRFGPLVRFYLYTGCRLSDALKLEWPAVELDRSFAYVGKTKNGEPRAVHLPPHLVKALKSIKNVDSGRVFGFSKNGYLYGLIKDAAKDAGVTLPPRVKFHLFRHTFAAWMRRHAGLDTSGLVGTGAWDSHEAARIYEHVEASAEAKKSDLLPTPPTRSRTANVGRIRVVK